METTDLQGERMSLMQLRGRLAEHGVRVTEFARAAGMRQSDVSAVLHGHLPLNAERQAKIEAAIERLGIDKDAAVQPDPTQQPILRIRQRQRIEH